MLIEKIICDYCGEEIPKAKTKDFFGNEVEYYMLGKLNFGDPFNSIYTRNMLGIDLCERCAENININIYKMKTELLNKMLIDCDKRKSNRRKGR